MGHPFVNSSMTKNYRYLKPHFIFLGDAIASAFGSAQAIGSGDGDLLAFAGQP